MKINHPRHYFLLAAAIVGLSTIVHIDENKVYDQKGHVDVDGYKLDIYIWRTNQHHKCCFPDGSHTEYKERYKWLFYAEPFRSAQTMGDRDSTGKYVDAKGNTHKDTDVGNRNCIGIGKHNGRLFWSSGFENAEGQFVDLSSRFNGTEGWGRRDDIPKGISRHTPKSFFNPFGHAGPPTESQKFLEKEHLRTYDAYVIPLSNDNTFLFEQPLVIFNNPDVATVLYVYQSLSTDNGKTWSPPVITKDAKLFEIGKLITEQSWSAKPEIKHP